MDIGASRRLFAIAALSAVIVALFGSTPLLAQSLVLYDNFEAPTINPSRFSPSSTVMTPFVRAIENGQLVVKNQDSQSPSFLENNVLITQLAGLRTVQADVTLREVSAPPPGAPHLNQARIVFTLYNDGTPGGLAGDITASLAIGILPNRTQPTAHYSITRCGDATCSSQTNIFRELKPITDVNLPHRLRIEWDGSNTVAFSVDGDQETLDPTQLGANIRSPKAGYTGLAVNGPRTSASFDNVLVGRVAQEGRPCEGEPTDDAIQYGDLITCTLGPVGDTDILRFAAASHDRITIRAARAGGLLEPCIELYGPDGALVTAACNATHENRLDVTLQRAGTHTIVVSDAGNNAGGTYNLAIERIAPLTRFGSLVRYGETLGGQVIGPVGDVDVFLLDGASGNRVRIQGTRTDGTLRPCLELYGPDASLTSRACDATNANRLDVTLTQNGTHTLLVSDAGASEVGSYSVSLQCLVGTCTDTRPTLLAASVLPSSRSVQVGTTATAFATVINSSAQAATSQRSAALDGPNDANALSCVISQLGGEPVPFSFQATDPDTNLPIGATNAPVNIAPGGTQSFVISLTPLDAFCSINLVFGFSCSNATNVVQISGVNTLLLTASPTVVPDMIALAATATNNGVVDLAVPSGAQAPVGAFAVATANIGSAGTITATPDTGNAALPVALFICETGPDGSCNAPPARSVSRRVDSNERPTFSVFVNALASVPFDPANNRVFVRFTESASCNGQTAAVTRGSTSVAVRTR